MGKVRGDTPRRERRQRQQVRARKGEEEESRRIGEDKNENGQGSVGRR